MNAATDQARLVAALACSLGTTADSAAAAVLETHISYVLLTGAYAYKIKKAVEFAFLDFRTLDARRFFCEEELRLNRRLAPELYLDVVPVTGSEDAPIIGGAGPALEYAVKMREFPQSALASTLLERGDLDAADIDALAATVAAFHAAVDVATGDFGASRRVLHLAQQNFSEIAPLLTSLSERREMEELREWAEREHRSRTVAFEHRREQGFVRECHGDLHLGNIARIDGRPVVFDCIEFNEEMRWIDVMSEIAFTVMDLEDRGRADLAHRFLNAYLETTGDYAGLAVLPFYLGYRALVRAKVALLRAGQQQAADAARAESRGYLRLAAKYARARKPALVITHGLSGSGKTAISQALVDAFGAVRVRSDVERKRMRGMGSRERAAARVGEGLYGQADTAATYDRLRDLAHAIVDSGRTALVDATFLLRAQRDSLRALAAELDVPFVILAFEASDATLRERVARRHAEGSDASDADLAVLAHQIATREPLAPDELGYAVVYDAEAPLEAARATTAWADLARRIGI